MFRNIKNGFVNPEGCVIEGFSEKELEDTFVSEKRRAHRPILEANTEDAGHSYKEDPY